MKDITLSDNAKSGIKNFIKGAVLIFILFLLFTTLRPFIIIGAGERGVVLNFGAVQDKVLDEGIHLRIPIMQRIIVIDVRVHKSQTDAEAASKDLQDTHSTIAVNYHILPEMANKVYQQIGKEYKERIIDPAVQEVVKAVTARYTAVELITQREKVRSEIKTLLLERLKPYNIVVDDFSIVNFKFSQQFTQAIESKQTAEQFALRAQRDLERIKIEAQQKITQAQAEAEALRIQKQNVTPELIQLRQIEVTAKAVEKWNGILPQVTSDTIPFIDVKSLGVTPKR